MPRRLKTGLDGLILIEPETFGDDRGYFVETWSEPAWRELGVDAEFQQQNHSRSVRGTLRGIHFQTRPGQAKLVRCARGRVFDVAVDLRRDSPTFGQWEGHFLSDVDNRQLYVPIGFGHGFCVVSEVADVVYQVSNLYSPENEAGIRWNDADLDIDWPIRDPLLSPRDRSAPSLAEAAAELPW